MSLRTRVLFAIALVLMLNALLGAGLAGLRAHATLKAELGAAMRGARASVERAVQTHDLQRLVTGFDGDRHVRVTLSDASGRVLLRSRPAVPAHAAPGWFTALVDAGSGPIRMAAGDGQTVIIEPSPAADIAASWLGFSDLMIVLLLACGLGCGLVFLLIGQALRPLNDLVASFGLIGSGQYRTRVAEAGASEIAAIGRAFNQMAGQLLSMQDRNKALEEQLLKLQDEERADLARDLHDEIGPYLFAVKVDAEVIGELARQGHTDGVQAQVDAIASSVAHMQARVRDILGRLRPTQVVELGLEPAIADVIAFWRARRPEIAFEVTLTAPEDALSQDVREAAYRVIQEGLSNAVRHGRPSRVAVDLALQGAGEVVVRVSDDGATATGAARREPGFGLLGMQERVSQAGGTLSIDQGAAGWSVTARLPAHKRRRARRAKAAA